MVDQEERDFTQMQDVFAAVDRVVAGDILDEATLAPLTLRTKFVFMGARKLHVHRLLARMVF